MLYGRRERWFQFVNLHGDRTQCKWLQTNYNLTSSKQDHRESCSASAAQLTQWEHPLASEEFGFRPNLSTKVALSHLSNRSPPSETVSRLRGQSQSGCPKEVYWNHFCSIHTLMIYLRVSSIARPFSTMMIRLFIILPNQPGRRELSKQGLWVYFALATVKCPYS